MIFSARNSTVVEFTVNVILLAAHFAANPSPVRSFRVAVRTRPLSGLNPVDDGNVMNLVDVHAYAARAEIAGAGVQFQGNSSSSR